MATLDTSPLQSPRRTTLRTLAACLALAVCAASCASVRTTERGLRAYQRHDYQAAIESWTPSQARGTPTRSSSWR